jgi:hypothetical protein
LTTLTADLANCTACSKWDYDSYKDGYKDGLKSSPFYSEAAQLLYLDDFE